MRTRQTFSAFCLAVACGAASAMADEPTNGQAALRAAQPYSDESGVTMLNQRVKVWQGGGLQPASATSQVPLNAPANTPFAAAYGQPVAGHPQQLARHLQAAGAQGGAADEAAAGANNGGGSCDACGDCDCDDCCCPDFWEHRTGAFGEFLYLHPTGIDMAHAIQQNGTGGAGTVPAGRVGVTDFDYEPGFRAGFGFALDSCSSVGAAYSQLRSHTQDTLVAPGGVGGVVQSLVLHPGSVNAASTSSLVRADSDIDFELIDLEYSRLFSGGNNHAINYVLGVRWAELDQDFSQIGSFSPPAGTIQTATNIEFDGIGLRLGFDGRRRVRQQWSIYGKGFVDVLFGEFRSEYRQTNLTTSVVQAASNWTDDRCVPILEYEVGVSWSSQCDRVRLSLGYYTAFWFNAVTTPEYVQAVQAANFVDLGDTVAFDGLVARAEVRF